MLEIRPSSIRMSGKAGWIIFAGLLGLICVIASESLYVVLATFTAFSLLVLWAYIDREFSNPIAIFTLFFYPYSTWFSYYTLLGTNSYDPPALLESIELSYLGLLSFFVAGIGVAAFQRSRGVETIAPRPRLVRTVAFRSIMVVSFVVISAAIVQAVLSNAFSKREVIETGSILVALSGFASVLLAAGGLIYLVTESDASSRVGTLRHWPVVAVLLLLFVAFLALGERDYFFRIAFCIFIFYFARKKSAGVLTAVAILMAVVAGLPLSQAAKGILLPGADSTFSYDLERLFYGEFMSGSRNTYMLIFYGVEHSYSYLWSDILRGLVPFSDALGFQSTSAWYNREFRVDNDFAGTSGWGFTLVGLGYLVGGRPGVMLVMAFASVILHSIYFRRTRSVYWYVFYCLSLTAAIYCIRADVANLLSQIFKVNGLAVLLFWLAGALFPGRKMHSVNLEKG